MKIILMVYLKFFYWTGFFFRWGILLDRIQRGKQFEFEFENPERVIIPQEQGKEVRMNKKTD